MSIKSKLIIAGIGNLIDTISTLIVVNYYGFIETNPVMAWLLQYPLAFIAVKILTVTGVLGFIWRTRTDKHANIMATIVAIVFSCIAVYYLVCLAILI